MTRLSEDLVFADTQPLEALFSPLQRVVDGLDVDRLRQPVLLVDRLPQLLALPYRVGSGWKVDRSRVRIPVMFGHRQPGLGLPDTLPDLFGSSDRFVHPENFLRLVPDVVPFHNCFGRIGGLEKMSISLYTRTGKCIQTL